MEQEEFDRSCKKDRKEQEDCLVGLSKRDRTPVLFITIMVLAGRLGRQPITVEEATNMFCRDDRKHDDIEGILGAVKKLLKVYENRR